MNLRTKTAHFSKRTSKKQRRKTQGGGNNQQPNGWSKHIKEIQIVILDNARPAVRFRAKSKFGDPNEQNNQYCETFGWEVFESLMDAVENGGVKQNGYGSQFVEDVFGASGPPQKVTNHINTTGDVTTLGMQDAVIFEDADFLHLFYDHDEDELRLPHVKSGSGGSPPSNKGRFFHKNQYYVWEATPQELVYTLKECTPPNGNGVTRKSHGGFSQDLREALFVDRDPYEVRRLVS